MAKDKISTNRSSGQGESDPEMLKQRLRRLNKQIDVVRRATSQRITEAQLDNMIRAGKTEPKH